MLRALLLSSALSLAILGTAAAQTSSSTPGAPGTGTTATSPSTTERSTTTTITTPSTSTSGSLASGINLTGKKLLDLNVKNSADESLGEIDDVVVGGDGKITQVVIQTGGVLGVGGRKVAVPYDQIKYDAAKDVAVLNMSKDQLKDAPEWTDPTRRTTTTRERAPGSAPIGSAPIGSAPANR